MERREWKLTSCVCKNQRDYVSAVSILVCVTDSVPIAQVTICVRGRADADFARPAVPVRRLSGGAIRIRTRLALAYVDCACSLRDIGGRSPAVDDYGRVDGVDGGGILGWLHGDYYRFRGSGWR